MYQQPGFNIYIVIMVTDDTLSDSSNACLLSLVYGGVTI